MALDIFKAFDRVWHGGLLHKLTSYGISGQILVSSFLSNRRLRVVLDGNSSQEYPVNAGVPQGSILGPRLLSVVGHLICGNNLNWLLNLNLVYETLWTGVRRDL